MQFRAAYNCSLVDSICCVRRTMLQFVDCYLKSLSQTIPAQHTLEYQIQCYTDMWRGKVRLVKMASSLYSVTYFEFCCWLTLDWNPWN